MPPTQNLLTRLMVSDALCEALFASELQPSDSPSDAMVAEAISSAVRQFGTSGCASRMAEAFGDHPDAAARRMRWARQLTQSREAGHERDL
jgi:hypothetical protein